MSKEARLARVSMFDVDRDHLNLDRFFPSCPILESLPRLILSLSAQLSLISSHRGVFAGAWISPKNRIFTSLHRLLIATSEMTIPHHFPLAANFPVYCLDWLSEDVLVYAGGGGKGRSGVGNYVVSLILRICPQWV